MLDQAERPSKSARLKQAILVGLFTLAFLALAASFAYLGKRGWPGLHWDAALYGPPVINVATGKGWLMGSYEPQITQRSSILYNFHGILHVFFYGTLLRTKTWEHYIFAQGIINSVTFVSYSITCLYLQDKANRFKPLSLALSPLIGLVAGVICISLQGRPEQLAPLLLCLPLVFLFFISNHSILAVALGAVLGLLTILSPLIGVFFAVFILFYYFGAIEWSPLKYVKVVSISLGTALIVSSALVWTVTPFSALEWFYNVFGVSQATVDFEGLLLRISGTRMGLSLIAPGWNILSLLLIFGGGLWLWRSKRSLASIFLMALALAFFNQKMCDYSYAPFIPFGLVLCLRAYLSSRPSITSFWGLNLLRAGIVATALSYLVVLLSFLAVHVLVPYPELSPVASRQTFASSEAGRALRSGASAVGFPPLTWPSMVVLGDAGLRYVSFHATHEPSSDQSLEQYESKAGARVNWYVYPQTLTMKNITPPDHIYIGNNRYALADNHWVTPLSVDFRLRPSRLTNRNNFALYRREA